MLRVCEDRGDGVAVGCRGRVRRAAGRLLCGAALPLPQLSLLQLHPHYTDLLPQLRTASDRRARLLIAACLHEAPFSGLG